MQLIYTVFIGICINFPKPLGWQTSTSFVGGCFWAIFSRPITITISISIAIMVILSNVVHSATATSKFAESSVSITCSRILMRLSMTNKGCMEPWCLRGCSFLFSPVLFFQQIGFDFFIRLWRVEWGKVILFADTRCTWLTSLKVFGIRSVTHNQ